MVKNTYLAMEQMIGFIEKADFKTIYLEECGQVEQGSQWDLSKHAHDKLEMIYMVDAKARINMSSQTLYSTWGDLIVYPPHHMHQEFVDVASSQKCIFLRFDIKSEGILQEPLKLKDRENKIYWILNEMVGLDINEKNGQDIHLMSIYIQALLINIKKNLLSLREEEIDLVESAISYIKQHHSEDLSVKRLANMFYVSTSYLSRKFVKKVGVSPMQYVNQVRIEKAKKLLCIGEMPVNEIAESVGIDDPKYFSRLFKKETQFTPSEFRKNYKDSSE